MSGRGRTPNDRQARDNIFRELVTKIDRFILPNEIKLDQIIGFGGFAEVYDADMCIAETDETKRVAVKRFRVVLSTAEEFAKVRSVLFVRDGCVTDAQSIQSFTREILIWKQLEHENILPLLGVTVIEGIPCTVSEWMENGTMDAYLIAHADADVFELVRNRS
jgi:serine/threonine protein kinase